MRNEYTDCVYYKDDIYYFLDETGIPLKENLKERRLEILTSLEGLKAIGRGSYFFTDRYGDYLVGLQMSAEKVVMIDLGDKTARAYKIFDSSYAWGNIAAAFIHQNLLLCFLKRNGILITFNLDTKEVSEARYSNKENVIFNSGIIIDDQVFLMSNNNCIMAKYSLLSGDSNEVQTEKSFDKPVEIKQIGSDIVVLEANGNLTRLSVMGEVKRDYTVDSDDCEFYRFCLTDNEKTAIILPWTGKNIYYLDMDSGELTKYDEYPDGFIYREADLRAKYGGYDSSNSCFFYANRSANYSLMIDKTSGVIEWNKQLEIPYEIEMAYEYTKKSILMETENNTLKNYVELIHKII